MDTLLQVKDLKKYYKTLAIFKVLCYILLVSLNLQKKYKLFVCMEEY